MDAVRVMSKQQYQDSAVKISIAAVPTTVDTVSMAPGPPCFFPVCQRQLDVVPTKWMSHQRRRTIPAAPHGDGRHCRPGQIKSAPALTQSQHRVYDNSKQYQR